MNTRESLTALLLAICVAPHVRSDTRSKLAMETAEAVAAKFGSRAASRGLPALAARIESLAAKHGPEAITAVRRVGPQAFELVEAAGINAPKAVRVLAMHGEAGAACVLRRPAAMAQFLKYGEGASAALCKHPGVAERVIERGGMSAVKAMAAVTPRNGRRVAMLMKGAVGKSPRHVEVLEVIAKYGDRGAEFVFKNKGALATAAGLTAFLANPEPFIAGVEKLADVAGTATVGVAKVAGKHVVAPVIGGIFTTVNCVIGVIAVVVVGAVVLMAIHGVPKAESVKAAASVIAKK